ncbi:hypothetical protein ACFY20_22765 [Streptomyces sp. NPDC001312]|uniref:hypothetical protein n=1 Tax=Streptomyces sp. NPDC001312 TaxID=3364561 RepID=UPI00368DAE90
MALSQFLQALTHKGPGYEINASGRDEWADSRRGTARFFDALSHRGPGYAPPSAEEIAENKRAANKSQENLKLASLGGIEKALYVKGSLEAAGRATDPEVRKEHLVAARESLQGLLQSLEYDIAIALSEVKEAVNPLDFRTRLRIRKAERDLETLVTQIRPFLQFLSDSERRPERFERRSQVATREVKRSIERFSHLAAAR